MKARTEDRTHLDTEDLDEEDRRILGEAKKKGYYHGRLGTVRSDEAPVPQRMNSADLARQSGEVSVGKEGSEWNQAGTWEEKDVGKDAERRLRAALKGAECGNREARKDPDAMLKLMKECGPLGTDGDGDMKIEKFAAIMYAIDVRISVGSCSGEASLAVVRGAKRFIFDFKADLEWRMTIDENLPGDESGKDKISELKGRLKLPEITDAAVKSQKVEMNATYSSSRPQGVTLSVSQEWLERLKAKILEQLDAFVLEFA